jgi:hypothetical protein
MAMKTFLRILVVVPAIFFTLVGVRWAVDPGAAAAALGMTLQDGLGRSTQIGDIGGFFFATGMMMLGGLVTARRTWFYAPALLLALIAVFRTLAWLAHDAALAIPAIVVELSVAGILLFAASALTTKD